MISRLVIIAIVLGSSLSRAQAPITLEDALHLAGQANLQLQQQSRTEQIAALEAAIKRGQRLPSVNVHASYTYTSEIARFDLPRAVTGGRLVQIDLGGHDNTNLTVGIRQPVFTGFLLSNQENLAETQVEVEETRRTVIDQQLAYRIHLLFFRSERLHFDIEAQRRSVERLQNQLDLTRNLYRAAQAMAFDTLQVYNQILQVEIQIGRLQQDRRLLALALANLLDLDTTRPLASMEFTPPVGEERSKDALLQVAIERRPELRTIRLRRQALDYQERMARANFWPRIEAEAGYSFAKPGLNQVANEWMDFARAGVTLQWNLWRGNQDRLRVEQTQVERSKLSLEERDLLRTIEYEIESSLEDLEFARRQIELARRLEEQQAERFRIVSSQQQDGQATTNDVVVAEVDLTQAELRYRQSIVDYYIAGAALQLATGRMTLRN